MDDWVTLNRVKALRKSEVVALFLLVDTTQEKIARFESKVYGTGGRVLFRDERLGYLRTLVSTSSYARLSYDEDVLAAQIDVMDVLIGYTTPSVTDEEVVQNIVRRARGMDSEPRFDLAAQPADSALFPANFMGLHEWRERYPTFDGRGVTVVTPESLWELDHPALQRALSIAGKPLPKLGRLFVTPSAFTAEEGAPGGDVFEVPGDEPPKASRVVKLRTDQNGDFTVAGVRYEAPAPGDYLFQTQSLGNGNYTPADHQYSMLWRPGAKEVWVDTNENRRFSDENPLGDFNTTHRISYLPNTLPLAAAGSLNYHGSEGHPLAFLAYFDRNTGRPRLLAGDNDHCTLTSGLIAGHNFAGGDGGSAAPGAQIDTFFGANAEPRSISASLEGISRAMLSAETDLLSAARLIPSVGNTPHSFAAEFLERVETISDKPQFWAAGNDYAKTTSVYSPSVGEHLLSVGGYFNGATLRVLDRVPTKSGDWVEPYSYGLSNGGQMKPDLLAPSEGVAPGLYSIGPSATGAAIRLPLGYLVGIGTSSATSVAASAAAALISGAKQLGLPHDAVRISWALKAGAKFLTAWPASAQGAGLIDLQPAWDNLKLVSEWPVWRFAPKIRISAPLRTRWVEFTHEASGSGVFEREGWSSGDDRIRSVVLMREDGPPISVRYAVRWLGNDGTFSLSNVTDETITLERKKPATLSVRVHPLERGAHSATLELLDGDSNLPVVWIPFEVIVADPLLSGSGGSYSVETTENHQFPEPGHHFIRVSEGVQLLRIEVTNQTGEVSLHVNQPLEPAPVGEFSIFDRVWETKETFWMAGAPVFDPENRSKTRTYLAERPRHGVWEFVTLGANRAWVPETRYAFRATALSSSLRAHMKSAGLLQVDATNEMGELKNAELRVEQGVMSRMELTAQDPVGTISVPAGISTLWLSGASSKTHRPARIWLYCGAASQPEKLGLTEVPFDPRPSLTVRRPEPGPWVIVADDADLQSGPVELKIVQTAPQYGDTVVGQRRSRHGGEAWRELLTLSMRPVRLQNSVSRVLLVELNDPVREDTGQESDSRLPQRPAAVGQTIVVWK